jgi:hypothetical protein
VRSDGVAGLRHRLFDGLADVMPVTLRDHLHDVVDRQLCGNLSSAVTANTIRQYGKQHREPVVLLEHKGGHGITVFVVLARHAGMGLCFDDQVSALCTDHTVNLLIV